MSARNDCSPSEIVFCENYIISLSKTEAAIAMGSESAAPGQIGWQVYQRPNVKAYIEELLSANTITANETLRLISDTANGNISHYMKSVKKWVTPTVKKGLQQLIDETRLYIQMEDEFCSIKGLTEEAYDEFQERLEVYRDKIIRYQIELSGNPDAFRLVDGLPEEVETMELDLALAVADKRRGIIKSFKHTKDGIQVELCDPDNSKERMAKIHGLYKIDNEQSKPDAPSVTIFQLPDNGRTTD